VLCFECEEILLIEFEQCYVLDVWGINFEDFEYRIRIMPGSFIFLRVELSTEVTFRFCF